MDQVSKQSDRTRKREDRQLDPGGDPEHSKADRNRLDPLARTHDRPIDETMRMTVARSTAVTVVMPVLVVVAAFVVRVAFGTHALRLVARSG